MPIAGSTVGVVPWESMKVGIPKEIYPHERRVAATPETVHKIRKLGLRGRRRSRAPATPSSSPTPSTSRRARTIAPTPPRSTREADLVLKVRQPIATADGHEADLLKDGRDR